MILLACTTIAVHLLVYCGGTLVENHQSISVNCYFKMTVLEKENDSKISLFCSGTFFKHGFRKNNRNLSRYRWRNIDCTEN